MPGDRQAIGRLLDEARHVRRAQIMGDDRGEGMRAHERSRRRGRVEPVRLLDVHAHGFSARAARMCMAEARAIDRRGAPDAPGVGRVGAP
jgi:hypothetical protein